jgi:hypothetical protein
MARLSTADKCNRVLLLLLGVRHRPVAIALSKHGFNAAALARGWALLARMTDGALDDLPAIDEPDLIAQLDGWENRWFPIVELVLRTNFPAAHEVVFRNLRQTEDETVIISVATLLDRLHAMQRSETEGGLGQEGRAARALLVERGLTEAIAAQARALLERIMTLPSDAGAGEPPSYDAAERELWRWYLEWSGLLRMSIKDRRLLRALGFLRNSKKSDTETE